MPDVTPSYGPPIDFVANKKTKELYSKFIEAPQPIFNVFTYFLYSKVLNVQNHVFKHIFTCLMLPKFI